MGRKIKNFIFGFLILALSLLIAIGGYWGWQKATAGIKDLSRGYELRGDNYYNNQNYPQAILAYQKALSLQPKNPTLHFRLANCYHLNKNYLEAEKKYKETFHWEEEFWEAYLNLGLLYLKTNKYNEAESILKRALNFNQSDLIYHQLGHCYFLKQDWQKAREYFQKAEEINPKNQEASWFLGVGLLISDSQRATNQFTKASLIKDWEPPLFFQTKEVLENKIQLGKNTALEVSKTKNKAYQNNLLGKFFTEIGFYNLALEYSKKATNFDPQYRDGWLVQGIAYYYLEDYNLALNSFKEAEKLDPMHSKTYLWLSKVYDKLGEENRSKESLEKSKLLEEEPKT